MSRHIAFLRGIPAVLCAVAAVSLFAGEALFPRPLHLVRKIEDPVSGTTSTVHEYCAGNRIVTVNGERVAIVDYEAQQILEIDRSAGTYSITRFEEAARAQPRMAGAAKAREPLRTLRADTYEARFENDVRLEIGVDRRVDLSLAAVEALIGAAYPAERRAEHDALLEASRGPRSRIAGDASETPRYGLPATLITTYAESGQTIVLRNTVLAVTEEVAPAELLAIPPGARHVDSRVTRMTRESLQ